MQYQSGDEDLLSEMLELLKLFVYNVVILTSNPKDRMLKDIKHYCEEGKKPYFLKFKFHGVSAKQQGNPEISSWKTLFSNKMLSVPKLFHHSYYVALQQQSVSGQAASEDAGDGCDVDMIIAVKP